MHTARAMRLALAALALFAASGCIHVSSDDDEPPIADRCVPGEAPLSLKDGPYGSGVEQLKLRDVYPSFRSDYPKRLVFERAKSVARIEYFHETHAVVETWSVGPLTSPAEGACNMTGHERGQLTLAGVTIDGVAGDLSRYSGWTATLMAGATVHYASDGGETLTTSYRHGFSPMFTQPCEFRRPADGMACNGGSICSYEDEGEHCTTRCADGAWQSFECAR